MSSLSTRVIAGKYALEREIAAGGMGAIWSARHLDLDERVAVKLIHGAAAASAEARARFAREARAAARVRSPHVVQVLDHGVDGDLPYLVMELLEGEHLGDRLQREGRLPLGAAAVLAEQIARALTRAHNAGIVHRDLKPANVFLARADGEEMVKLLDFGIARPLDRDRLDVTGADVLMGSPQYMSPEQARGAPDLDHRADLFSLGALLFRAVTGAPAFEGGSAVDVIVRICAGPVPSARSVAPDLPAEVDAFFTRALDRDPARRFPSAREMAAAFHAAVAGAGEPARDGALGSGPRPAAPAEEIAFLVERAFEALVEGAAPTPRSPGEAGDHRAPEPTVPLLRRLGAARVSSVPPPDPGVPSGAHPLPAAFRKGAASALLDRGLCALRRGERESARSAWREALELDPDNRAAAVNLRRLDALGGRSR